MMKVTIVMAFLPSSLCVAGAILLAILGVPNWVWLLVVAWVLYPHGIEVKG